MKAKEIKLARLVSKEERVLAFQFKDLEQPEVRTAIDLEIAELVDGYLGGVIIEPHLFIKTNVDKKGRSTWRNIHKNDCVIISYRLDTEGSVMVEDAKKISFSQLANKYTDDETPDLFEKREEKKNTDNSIKITDANKNNEVIEVRKTRKQRKA